MPEKKSTRQKLNPSTTAGRILILALSLALVGILAYLDYATGPYMYFITFYLIPLALAVWLLGRWAGGIVLAVSALAWTIDEMALSSTYAHPFLPYWNIALKLGFFIAFLYTFSAFMRILRREKMFAATDYLTGLANRRYFFDVASKEVSRLNRYGQPLTLVYLDIDNFKHVNDFSGHARGDALLSLIATTLDKNVRAIDTVARVGGDEFAILLPETPYAGAETAIRRIRIELLAAVRKRKYSVTFSIGAVTCANPCEFEPLMTMADIMMYSAKKSGKNSVRHEMFDASSGKKDYKN